MTMSIPSYLRLSRHNVFYFRWPIPACLHPLGKAQHVETSLRTRNPRLALQMARYLAYHAENIMGQTLGMKHIEVKRELQAFFSSKLAEFTARREHNRHEPFTDSCNAMSKAVAGIKYDTFSFCMKTPEETKTFVSSA